jgi:equilibrative nucleoside transporter 1/2/3
MPHILGINFFYCTVTSIVIVSIACTMMQDGLFRITANFPSIFTQGIISGQALAGLIISIGNFCIVLFKHENIIKSSVFLKLLLNDVDFCAFVYFAGAMMMLLLCVITFWLLQKQKSLLLELFWMQRSKQNPMKETTISERFLNDELASRENLLGVEKAMEELEAQSETGLLHIVYKIRYFAMSVFMVFFVSLGAFPAITSMIHSMHPTKGRFFQELFIPFTFVLWNAGDFVGRQASSCCNRWSGSNLVVASVTRLAFFPLFMFCNLQNDHGQTLSHVLFRNDVFPFVFIFLCAFTNGFLCTMAMMEYPTVLRTKKQKEMGGTLMFCVISIGLTSGSLMSFVLEALLQA